MYDNIHKYLIFPTIFGHISTRSRKDLNSEAAGREVAHDWRDRKYEFVQK